MERCRICRARLFDGAAFCARCLTPVAPTDEELAEATVDVAAAAGRWHRPRERSEQWHPDPVHTDPRPVQVHSRWRPGVFSFSLPTKIVLAFVVVLGVPYLAWQVSGPLAIGPIAIWHIIVTPRVLRDLWRRTRVG